MDQQHDLAARPDYRTPELQLITSRTAAGKNLVDTMEFSTTTAYSPAANTMAPS